jgi:SAM-dependent methyltransferase
MNRGSYYADSYRERWSLRHAFHKRRLDTLARIIPSSGRVLDAGCGSGVLCRLLADRGCRVAGVDLLQSRVNWCKQFVPEGEFRLGDLRTCTFPGEFDVVVASEVLEHVATADRLAALANLARHVKKGGSLVVTVPSAWYLRIEPLWEMVRGWQYGDEGHDDELRHELISPLTLENEFREVGCGIERKGTMCWGLIRWWIARKQ